MSNEFIARKGLRVLAGNADVTGNLSVTGIVSASQVSGAFYGGGAGVTGIISSSYAVTASAATSITFVPATASYALTAGASGGGLTGNGNANAIAVFSGASALTSSVIFADATHVTMSVPLTASAFQGNGAGVTGVISASFAGTDWIAINNKPTVFSSSLQLNSLSGPITGTISGTLSGSVTGTLIGSASYATNATNANSSLTATSASFAPTDWFVINNKPVGIVSSSAQTVTNIAGTTISPSFITASAINVTGVITALQFNSQFVSSSIIYQSGSTKFGDTQDDVMSVTGTVALTGSLIVSGGSVTFVNGLGPTRIAGALYSTGSTTANVGTTVVATVVTSSYDTANFQYVVRNSTGSRAGTVMAVWSASVVEYTDISTADLGAATSDISFTVDVLGDIARFKAVVVAINGWTVKGIIQAI